MKLRKEFYGEMCDVRTHLMGMYNDLKSPEEKVFFCENLKTLLCEMELLVRYEMNFGGVA